MSRSYKKSPVFTDQSRYSTRWVKRQASKAVRRYAEETSNGKWYRRVYCPWNICDYRFYIPLQQALRQEGKSRWFWSHGSTRDEVIKDWKRDYYRK